MVNSIPFLAERLTHLSRSQRATTSRRFDLRDEFPGESAYNKCAMDPVHISVVADSRFVLDPFEPAYSMLSKDEVARRVEAGLCELEDCCACPRNCHVNRMANKAKICNTGRYARVSSSFPHFGEEDCLRGWAGSAPELTSVHISCC